MWEEIEKDNPMTFCKFYKLDRKTDITEQMLVTPPQN